MRISRRNAIGLLAGTAALTSTEQEISAQDTQQVTVDWLGGNRPGLQTGVSWGVPWARGSVKKEQSFTLAGGDGKVLPLQSWPLAYWPDGSIKWTGFATVPNLAGP